MNNPDWRQRGILTESKESSYPTMPAKQAPSRGKPVKRDGAENHRQLLPTGSSLMNTLHAKFSQPRPRAGQSSSAETEDSTNYDEARAVGLGVIQSKETIGKSGKPWAMSLIEIVPFCGGHDHSAAQDGCHATNSAPHRLDDIVEIRRIGGHKTPKNHRFASFGQDQNEQLAAALRVAGETPKKMKRPEPFSFNPTYEDSTAENTTRSSSIEIILSGGLAPDASLANNQHRFSAPGEAGNRVSPPGQVSGANNGEVAGTKANGAFERMIQRLHKKIDKDPKLEDVDEKDLHSEKSNKWANVARLGMGQNSSSNSGYGSMPWSGNMTSRARGGSNSSSGTIFNPKAREFFSVVAEPPPHAVNVSLQPRIPLRPSLQEYFNPIPGEQSMEPALQRRGYRQDPSNMLMQNRLPFPLVDSGATSVDTQLPTLPSSLTDQPAMKPMPQLYTNSPMTWNTPNPSPPVLPIGTMPVGTSNGSWPNTNTLPVPSMIPGMMPVLPGPSAEPLYPAAGSMPVLQKPAATTMMHPQQGSHYSTNAPAQRHPVPKPRIPDPRNQQAYEAWIEWRKANEPGYAMECKLRQQRRAQKSVGSKPNHYVSRNLEVGSTA